MQMIACGDSGVSYVSNQLPGGNCGADGDDISGHVHADGEIAVAVVDGNQIPGMGDN